jgi:hypothetical protein
MIMVPPHARFACVPIAFCSGFAGGLNGTLSFHVGGVSVVGTKHISSPLERDNAWLHATAHRAAVESPEPVAAIRRKLGGRSGISQSLQPDERGLSAVLGQNALGKPGECNAARRKAIWCGQERKSRSTSCPLLAQSGHSYCANRRPLSGVKRASQGHSPMSAYDPKRTWLGRIETTSAKNRAADRSGVHQRVPRRW